MRQTIRLAAAAALFLVALTACITWPFSSGPEDIRVISVTQVDLANQDQLRLGDPRPLPSKAMFRIEFQTHTDLLDLAKRKDYNVSFKLGLCTKDGVKDIGVGAGYVFWNKQEINWSTAATNDYVAAVAKGPPYSYQVYASPWKQIAESKAICFTLAGGNMAGGRLRSNVVRVAR